MNDEWLKDLKAGDEVVYPVGYWGESIGTVARFTATQIVLTNGAKYRRDTGRVIGSGYSRLEKCTPEKREKIIGKSLSLVLAAKLPRDWQLLPAVELQAILDKLNALAASKTKEN